ncbi:hypothetical protein BGZ81_006475 [Podila clonocystis]|nr:hypothetical protein BGZ81_006475 [Podila clonocystis]
MVNKAPKAAKAPKTPKADKRALRAERQNPMFGDGSLFQRSQQFVKDHDAKPFRDFGYVVITLLSFFIWRLSAAVQSHHEGAIGVWSFFVFGTILLLNIWSYFLVMVCAKRKGDIGIVRVVDDDIIRFIWMSGLFGSWAAIIYFRYKGEDPKFFLKAIGATILNVFWAAIAVKYYL